MILLLAGTGAARRLATDLVAVVPVIASLSGATRAPTAYPCAVRRGGFGGADAMAAWLAAHEISAIVDATHPYAAQISANALQAAALTGTPIIGLHRPPWAATTADDWRPFRDLESAVSALPSGARAFFATGRGGVEIISRRRDVWSALRVVDDPQGAFPGNGEFIVARPPFDLGSEKALFSLLGITHLVAKNAGGEAARTKLDAAAALGLPVMLIERPGGPCPPTMPAADIPAWAARQIAARTGKNPHPDQ